VLLRRLGARARARPRPVPRHDRRVPRDRRLVTSGDPKPKGIAGVAFRVGRGGYEASMGVRHIGGLVADLKAAVRGEVVERFHPEYDRARQVWNGLIDRYPTVIARCTGTADVVAAVRAARQHRPVLSIR